MCLCLNKLSDTSVARAVVSMVTKWALLRRPTAQTGSEMASFSTLDLAEVEKNFILNFTTEEKEMTEEKAVVCAPKNRSREEWGDYVLDKQMREMDEERHSAFEDV